MMVRASWAETVKGLSGVTGVSQVWGNRPEWYLWISGQPGPYGLVLEHTTELVEGPHNMHQGFFTVKCFPCPQSAAFASYSRAEQEIVKSSYFDRTNTPVYEARPEIPPSFFNIGSMLVSADAWGKVAAFTFESLDTIRLVSSEYYESALHSCDPTFVEGDLLRSVAGWTIGYPLFNSLACLYAFYVRRPPVWFRMSHLPGFEHVQKTDGNIESRPCAQSRTLSASLVFADDSIKQYTQWMPEPEEREKILFDSRLDPETLKNGQAPDPHINLLWWHLAEADIVSEMASLCGCSDHHLNSCEAGHAHSCSLWPQADPQIAIPIWKG
ncbi:MAG: hypothetical protein R6V76_13825 [Desulfobacterales bacterium]